MYYVRLVWYNPESYNFLVHTETVEKAEWLAKKWLYDNNVVDEFDFEPNLVWLQIHKLDMNTEVPPNDVILRLDKTLLK